MSEQCRRLIEIDLPIRRISIQARRDRIIGQGHISTLHLWWARRPLAACRAVVCAALWPDPADVLCPNSFRIAAKQTLITWTRAAPSKVSGEGASWFIKLQKHPELLDDPQQLRDALLNFVAEFCDWDCSVDPTYLKAARDLTHAAHVALGGDPNSRPLVMDPFAGGGSIPLEAMRVGADAFAADLNPIAVFINRVLLEHVPRHGVALADQVRSWGARLGERAQARLAKFYPNESGTGVPIAYIWARCVRCEGPACGIEVPLIRNMQISKKGRGWAFATEETETRELRVRVLEGKAKQAATVASGSATCPRKSCGYTTSAKAVRTQLVAQQGGARSARLIAVCVDSGKGRFFREPLREDHAAVALASSELDRSALPTEEINPVRPYKNTRGLSAVTRIGIRHFADLYNDRQALSLMAFLKLVLELRDELRDSEMGEAIAACLQCAASRLVFQNCSLSRWHATYDKIEGAFGKQALQNTWDFAESNPTSNGPAAWQGAVEWVAKVVQRNAVIEGTATVAMGPAQNQILPDDSASALITDPPYFASIPYGDLSDVFYVWERNLFRATAPDLYHDGLVDKSDEAIVTEANQGRGGTKKSPEFYRREMTEALAVARASVVPGGIGVVVFADTRTDSWEAILGAIIDAGWMITASWPIDTEHQNRTQAAGAASLQSSIHIVCRPREGADGRETDVVGDWRDVLAELPMRVHQWLPRLGQEGIVGADAIFACLGPALEVFSRYSLVEKPSGDRVSLGEYLEQVWAAVSREALSTIFEEADASGFEEDARLTAMWLWTLYGGAEESSEPDDSGGSQSLGYGLEFDAARKIAQGLGVHLERLEHVVEVDGDVATLLSVRARTAYLFGKASPETARPRSRKAAQMHLGFEVDPAGVETDGSGWEGVVAAEPGRTTLDQLHQAMILFGAGRADAMRRLLVDEGVGRRATFWRLAQALSALYPAGTDEKRWVDGVLARKKGLGL